MDWWQVHGRWVGAFQVRYHHPCDSDHPQDVETLQELQWPWADPVAPCWKVATVMAIFQASLWLLMVLPPALSDGGSLTLLWGFPLALHSQAILRSLLCKWKTHSLFFQYSKAVYT